MEYGLIVKQKDLDILDQHNVEYSFWDGFDLFDSEGSEQLRNDKIEITFESKHAREEAFKLIKSR